MNDNELQTLSRIIIRCSANFQKFLDNQSGFEISTTNSLLDIRQKGKIQFDIFSILANLDSTDIYPPSYFKKKIDDHFNKDRISEPDESDSNKKLLNNADLSKIFENLMEKGIIENIRDKNEINAYRHKIKRKKIYKTEGRISFYKTSDDFEQVKKVLTKPQAVKFLTHSFNQTQLFSDFLKAWFKYTIHNIKKTKDTDNLRYSVSFFLQSRDEKSDISDWDSFIKLVSSIDDVTLDLILEEVSKAMRQNPIIMQIIYLVLGSNII